MQVENAITVVNGKKPDSAESLVRLPRDVLAIGDATLTVKVGDKIEKGEVAVVSPLSPQNYPGDGPSVSAA